jgi:hypothetical protein
MLYPVFKKANKKSDDDFIGSSYIIIAAAGQTLRGMIDIEGYL